ncbi:35601_t:CDS:1, partial [Racocetra persica]
GKTSLVKAIQHLGEEPWISFGVDSLSAAIPTKYFSDSPGGMKATEGVKFISDIDKEGFPVLRVETGSYVKRFFQT